jgi:tetratricopeptide (TPR) repeat protein
MRRFLLLICIATALLAMAADRYTSTAVRANRSYEWQEWNNAAALYELMLDMQPDSATTYARAIVSNEMAGDTAASIDLMERAMAHNIGLAEILELVRTDEYRIGGGDRYGEYLYMLREHFSWMRRALDNELLNHYSARRDGPMMVEFATDMLVGLPESTHYLGILAEGYALQGDFDNATKTWQQILQIDSDNYDALLNLGNYYTLAGQASEAETYLTRAHKLRPTPYVTELLK